MKSNESILMLRDHVIQVYKMYERLFHSMAKFITSLYMILEINKVIGYSSVFTKSYVIGILACICGILPIEFMMLMAIIVIVGNMLSFNVYLGIMGLVIFLCLYIFFIRLYPKESVVIIFTILAFRFNLHYAVVIIAALFGGVPYIVAVLIGVLGVFSVQRIEIVIQATLHGVDHIEVFIDSLKLFTEQVIYNSTMLATMSVLFVVFGVVYVIRRQMIDYASYIGIVIGGAINVLGFIMAILFLNISINVLILITMSIISIVLASIIQFMAQTLDYSRSETVQFEDEDNYYYVKVVPKIKTRKNYSKVEKIYTAPKANEMIE